MTWRFGVDSGGTFTDICLFNDETGAVAIWKVSSTPDDPSRGISGGAMEAADRHAIAADAIGYFGHGTTVATNALIEHKGVPTGLITSRGMRDVLEIGRQTRPDLYDFAVEKPPVLVPRNLRLEVAERILHDGRVEVALDEDEVRAAARRLGAAGVKAIAIAFLHGFAHPEHEERAKAIVEAELPGCFVCTSREVSPEFREYERFSTAAVNAYLGPIMERYINRLDGKLKSFGIATRPLLTQSNGGVIGFSTAARLPVRTVLSGPSTGVVAAQKIGQLAGYENLITFDMGGTSSDVALLSNGHCPIRSDAKVHGYPIKAPMLDIDTVGAGGGSIAYIDNGGLLKVGPRSAGAYAGPVCYGNGNTEPTVTDANVLLQTLNPTHLLAGRMPIDRELSRKAIATLAEQLGLDTMAAANGILQIVTANMAKAIRVISVQRGYDPRDYSLMAFGGAGPLHAARLALELDMPRVIIPRTPGVLCAMGILLADMRTDFARTELLPLETGSAPQVAAARQALLEQADAWFSQQDVPAEAREIGYGVDVRYVGQSHELSVPLPEGPFDEKAIASIVASFEAAHERLYGFVAEADPIQIVTFRLEAVGKVAKAEFQAVPDAGADAGSAIIGRRKVWFAEAGDYVECPVYDRERLGAGNIIAGPAVVEQMDTTTIIPQEMAGRVDPYLNLILERV